MYKMKVDQDTQYIVYRDAKRNKGAQGSENPWAPLTYSMVVCTVSVFKLLCSNTTEGNA